jgi:uncharacterized protein (TIGR03067 family)
MTTRVLLSLAIAMAAPASKDPPKKDPPALVGEWAAESAVEQGRAIALPPGTGWVFTADRKSVLTLGGAAGSFEATYKADATKAPAEVDVSDGPKGKPLRGIFKVEGDTLTVCLVEGDADRPTAFESAAGSKTILITLKRVKPKG